MKDVAFVSDHLDLTQDEFDLHYAPVIDGLVQRDFCFVVGDADLAGLAALVERNGWEHRLFLIERELSRRAG